MNAPIQVCES